MRRLITALPFALATYALAPSALANDVPKYGDLPGGRLTTMPTTKIPGLIAAREHVPGFFVAMPKFGPETPARARHISIVGNQKDADSIRKGDGSGSEDRDFGTCFSESRGVSQGDEAEDPEAHEWSSGQMREVDLWPKSKDNGEAGVGAVHSERIVEENGKVRLDSVDAWVDPSTQGARLIARASLPLVLVGTSVGGVKVYAGRDERAASAARFVQFVVVRPGSQVLARTGTLMAIRQDGNSAQGNGCGHLRMPLVVDAKYGDSAIVSVPIELPSHDPAAINAKTAAVAMADAPKADDAAATASTSTALKGKRRFKGKGAPPPPPPVTPPVTPVEREVRTRDVQVHLSVSQTARDKEPLVAVSFGWSSRETVHRVTDDVPGSPGSGE